MAATGLAATWGCAAAAGWWIPCCRVSCPIISLNSAKDASIAASRASWLSAMVELRSDTNLM
ncbi:hypothetical protein MANES_03G119732v8 [Manihot esculenta]|uniref:Uncharacterized protein n=1 Tax=Manihot esculenta TaxID=3983 RepID=A0ACB7I1J2_MANES|nr:hypothetical protein MANES_03G119732v8 [Manihot esculenta]